MELIVRGYTNQYIITCECAKDAHKATNGWHMHFLIGATEKDYRNLIQKLKLKYRLTGKTLKDNAHGYGRVRGELRDTERYISYMFKDQEPVDSVSFPNLFRFGHFALDYLIDLQNKSYPKVNSTNIRDDIMNYIGETIPTLSRDETTGLIITNDHPCNIARERIIQYYREHTDKAPTRSRVQQLMMHYFILYNQTALTIRQISEWFYA